MNKGRCVLTCICKYKSFAITCSSMKDHSPKAYVPTFLQPSMEQNRSIYVGDQWKSMLVDTCENINSTHSLMSAWKFFF